MIKNILFDIDDTLFDFIKGERDALSRALRANGIEPNDKLLIGYNLINDRHWKMLEKGIIAKEELNFKRFEAFFGEYNINLTANVFCHEYEDNLSHEHFEVDGARDLLSSLSPEYRLYAASNGFVKTQRTRLAESGFDTFFEDVFISEEIGFDKPSVEFFEKAFSRIPDFKKEETVIIGDSLTSDIQGGVNAGIHTIWFNYRQKESKTELVPDFETSSLYEIKNIIDTLNNR